ncbi:MAG: S1C family serine protease [Puniceicoccaceae bacterium]
MNIRKIRLVTSAVCLALLSPVFVQAAEEEAPMDENIKVIVTEAKEAAKAWAGRLQEWKTGGKTSTTYFGVVIESVPDVLRDYVDIPEGVGLLFTSVAKDGPAQKAGIEDNDIIVKFDDQLIVNYSQFSTLIDMKGPGATVPVTIMRKGKEMVFEVTLEERIRSGGRFLMPDVPAPPAPPSPDDVGMFMQNIEEWIPGSVRVFVDEMEHVHVDMEDLREDLGDLHKKIRHIKIHQDGEDLITEHGDMGARTTVVRVADRNINYVSDDGKVVLNSSGENEHAMVWDAEGELIYDGDVPDNYAEVLPGKAVELIDVLKDSQQNLDIEEKIEIHLNHEAGEPVTVLQ